MTPLARALFLGHATNEPDVVALVPQLLACQFFEITAVAPLIHQMAWDAAYGETRVSGDDLFLPSEPCFIEWSDGWNGQRDGWLLERMGSAIQGTMLFGSTKGWVNHGGTFSLFNELKGGLVIHPMEAWSCPPDDADGAPSEKRTHLYERAFLALALGLINTPRLIGRRQHMPDAKLEKSLLSRKLQIGNFAVRAWTEILLKVCPTVDASSGPSRVAHLTGQKAMHFCRAHLRLRLGRLEIVRGHWRGDASLGVKRSRYIVSRAERRKSA
jgi:hypothetical protein